MKRGRPARLIPGLVTAFMNTASNATQAALPDIRAGSDGAGGESIRWDLLVSRLLHPIQVSMIEALAWVGLPISPSDLSQMYGGRYSNSHTGYHVKALARLEIIEPAGTEPVRGVTRHLYVLKPGLTWQ